MINQRTATVNTLLSVLSERGVHYELNGSTPLAAVLTTADKSKAVDMMCIGFKNGQVQMSSEARAKYSIDSELRKYVVGLVNNWIRKAPEFNGTKSYVAQNPGSRSNSTDARLKALKSLMTLTSDPTMQAEIQQAIADRLEELKPTITIDASLLPEHLRHLVE